jgi:outer membrane protein, heavy metal efflux system
VRNLPSIDTEECMVFEKLCRHCVALVLMCSCATVAFAQTAITANDVKRWTLAELFSRAWSMHPAAALVAAIDAEADAKLVRAQSWLAAPPSLEAGIRTDAITRSSRREGLREIEFEVAAPIASAARRSLQSATANAEAQAQRAAIETQRLKLAGETRDAYWNARTAESEAQLARDEATRARALADDSARRTRAGESARVDTLQAEANAQQAANAWIEAQGKLEAALVTLTQLVGTSPGDPRSTTVTALADSRERRPTTRSTTQAQGTLPATHATLAQARATSAAARARLNEASRLASEPPSAKFTLASERTNETGSKHTARIGFSIPFDAAFRIGNFNAVRSTQAARELAEADAATLSTERAVLGEIRAAELALATAEARVPLAKRRAELASEAAALYEKAYRLGELDLPTRLRIESERALAARDAVRAELELEHAISRLQQALGNLP